ERARTLGLTLGQIEKQFGKGSIVRLGSKEAIVQVAAISSGSISLDNALGVDVDNLLVSQPDYAEQALEITSALIVSGSIDVLVVDSVAALVPKAELD